MEKVFVPLLIMLGGIFAFFCALKDYEWFMGHRKAQRLTSIFGRTAVRFFYMFLGLAVFVTGLVVLIKGPESAGDADDWAPAAETRDISTGN